MSFEEKYNQYRHLGNPEVSDGYVTKLSNSISDSIALRKKNARSFAWSLYGASAALGILVIAFLTYPYVFTENTGSSEQNAFLTDTIYLSGNNGIAANKNSKLSSFQIDNDAIMEYLMDEGYDEI